jgi:hypothetical protein
MFPFAKLWSNPLE